MAEEILLRVLTPTGVVAEARTSSVEAPGVQGQFGILPGHTPYLAVLQSGTLSWASGGGKVSLALRGGIAEVKDDRMVILAPEACRAAGLAPQEIGQREQEVRSRIEDALLQGMPTSRLEDELQFLLAVKSLGAAGEPHAP